MRTEDGELGVVPAWFSAAWADAANWRSTDSSIKRIDSVDADEIAERFRAYARKQLANALAASTRLVADQTKVKLVDRLHRELSFCRGDEGRLRLVLAFLDAINELMLLALEIDPPELVRVERIVVSQPASSGAAADPAGIAFAEDETP